MIQSLTIRRRESRESSPVHGDELRAVRAVDHGVVGGGELPGVQAGHQLHDSLDFLPATLVTRVPSARVTPPGPHHGGYATRHDAFVAAAG
eukprot:CAMPEP_0181386860 /NCGR_PEP_ID=MMETSP1106-20121128/23384_1 /TAXON_ID=81844 /ORGANISM="Mantoniella antarctica, Strain SL-175" /LENGTH=90 /DNA_ID=CAMNT_0023507147 /DNA_START=349 /DNA_END=622 /DNA_ORIENTATION=-